ncbi:MAG TPA: hypothetical protein VKS98_05705 [Chthoniobacterales bacterium]|nr:hypothetical protein [Chthoniobacterales bacterium]
MKAAFQFILIAARLWPLLAVGAAFTTAAENPPPPKAAFVKSEQFLRELVDRVRPLASK